MSKRWPGDAIMIVASALGEENRQAMESVVVQVCRDCGCQVGADSHTIRRAMSLPSRNGRPVKFFCIPCYLQYDLGTITEFHDDRRPVPASAEGRS